MNDNELAHYGLKGMKWGIRRFQNEDGTLTEAGKRRYGVSASGEMSYKGLKKYKKDVQRTVNVNSTKLAEEEDLYRDTAPKAWKSIAKDASKGKTYSNRTTKLILKGGDQEQRIQYAKKTIDNIISNAEKHGLYSQKVVSEFRHYGKNKVGGLLGGAIGAAATSNKLKTSRYSFNTESEWKLLNDAKKKLGITGDELSESDWRAINNEIKNMRR